MAVTAAHLAPVEISIRDRAGANWQASDLRRNDNGLVGMALFIGAETMLFAGLISAFWILRAGADLWPPPGQPRLPVVVTGLNTLVLLLSAVSMQLAATRSSQGRRADVIRWLGWTAFLGAFFLAVQGIEWVRLLGFGLRASSGLYASTFYTIVGCHGIHVLVAVTALLVVLRRLALGLEGRRLRSTVLVCRLYWFFVVGIWPLLYALVYLS